jgi:hypothetical protein
MNILQIWIYFLLVAIAFTTSVGFRMHYKELEQVKKRITVIEEIILREQS